MHGIKPDKSSENITKIKSKKKSFVDLALTNLITKSAYTKRCGRIFDNRIAPAGDGRRPCETHTGHISWKKINCILLYLRQITGFEIYVASLNVGLTQMSSNVHSFFVILYLHLDKGKW